MIVEFMEVPLWKGRDVDKPFWVGDANQNPTNLSVYTRFKFVVMDSVDGDMVFEKDTETPGEITVSDDEGQITVHIRKDDMVGVTIPLPDAGPYGANIGPGMVALPFDMVAFNAAGLMEQLFGGVILLQAPAKSDVAP